MITPHALYYAIMVNVHDAFDADNIIYNVLVCIATTYYCSTFFIYLVTGQVFRKEAADFFTNIKRRVRSRSQTTTQGAESSAG